ncbi:uncharacterized protein LOC128551903, partial [Mercenaria mercenaria]|uniref:uncharacterized protein LOC128551903 n=1 Tax=Mercenaria mercenaria TaxID=6596 RepID=UPI00234E84DC
MAHQLDFKNKKYEQWVKAGLGVEYLGEGLYPFCDEVVTRQHNDILDTIKQTKNLSTVTCGQCNLNKLKPDHVQTGNKQCPLSQANCNCLHPSGKQPCPNDVCGAIYDHIVTNYGSTPPAPYWRNTEAKWWCTDPWSVAKCFINSPVHYDIIDCTGFLRLIINNQGFHNHIQCTINGTDVFSKVLQYSNEIFHSSSMELEENTANTYIDAMIAILQDDKELKTREYAQNAVQKLLELKKDDFIIPTKDELHMANASMASISGTTEEFESKLQVNLGNEMKELKTEQPRQRDL